MFTLWAEGKIVFGENMRGRDHTSYGELDATVVIPVYTRSARQFDFHRTHNVITESGAPIHGLINEFGGFEVEMEAFCNNRREASCFVRIRITNKASYRAFERFGFLVRRGKEKELVFGSPDEYVSYAPEIATIKHTPATFSYDRGVLRDGAYFVSTSSALDATYDEKTGVLLYAISLAPAESVEILLCIGKGESFPFDYFEERRLCEAFWAVELARIQGLPSAVQNDPEMSCTVRHLTAQMLQCFCYLVGESHLIQRQGGLQRLIWPWESKPVLEALGKLGDFSDYIEPVLSFYFDAQQQTSGEVKGLGEAWASITSCSLYSLATCAVQKNCVAYWEHYRGHAVKAFDWLKNKRAESRKQEGDIPGLFPSMRGCDWPHVFQHWTNTDCWLIFALEALSKAMHRFDDPLVDTVDAELVDYKATVKKVFSKFQTEAEGRDELRIPLSPTGADQELLDDFYPYLLHGPFTYLFLSGEDVWRARRWLERRGIVNTEYMLHANMPYRDGNTHIWYVCAGDRYWFCTYLREGDRSAAKRTLDAMMRYAMTDECYMQERYCDNDPYYVPWSPNASASGRFLLMLIEYYT
jgi:hypothetical protein